MDFGIRYVRINIFISGLLSLSPGASATQAENGVLSKRYLSLSSRDDTGPPQQSHPEDDDTEGWLILEFEGNY